MPIRLLLAALVSLACLGAVHAADYRFDLKVENDKDRDKEKMKDDTYGEGQTRQTEIHFDGKLRNLGFDAAKGITVKLYVFAIPNVFNKVKEEPFLAKMLTSNTFDLTPNAVEEFPFGEVQFTSSDSAKGVSGGTMLWKSGAKYLGWAAEILVGDKVVATEADGSKMMKVFKTAQKEKKLDSPGS